MFGEYAQIASYLPSSRDSSGAGDFPSTNLPPHLLPPPPTLQPPWPGGGRSRRGRGPDMMDDKSFVEDFVMVAEFSEIEGPKPVMTIPKEAGSSVDQNALSVKLMACDHQTSSEGFSISEDTQVVLSDDESGVSAFVHHFVLYDNQARGFVRPYCMVFVSPDIRKIMMFYEELSSQFKRAARFLKYGNRLLFVKDLERHVQNLEHTKEYLLNQVSRMRLKETSGANGEQSKVRSNAENELYKGLQNIRQSTTEIKDILTILRPLLHDHRLESRFRALEERAFQHGAADTAHAEKLSLQEDHFSDNMYTSTGTNATIGGSFKESTMSPVSLFKAATVHTPRLVETKKAKRFNSSLRGLHELCSWGAKEGLRKLRCIHEYFKKDALILELEKNESRLMEPTNSMVIHGHCVTTNVLAGVLMRGSSLCISEDSSSILMSGDKLQRWPSIASDDTLESFKSVDSYLSVQDEDNGENASLYSLASDVSSPGVTTSASAQDFLSAPTSPMTEEVAFPPPSAASSTITPTTSSNLASQPTETTSTTSTSGTTATAAKIEETTSSVALLENGTKTALTTSRTTDDVAKTTSPTLGTTAAVTERTESASRTTDSVPQTTDTVSQMTKPSTPTLTPQSMESTDQQLSGKSSVINGTAGRDSPSVTHLSVSSELSSNSHSSDSTDTVLHSADAEDIASSVNNLGVNQSTLQPGLNTDDKQVKGDGKQVKGNGGSKIAEIFQRQRVLGAYVDQQGGSGVSQSGSGMVPNGEVPEQRSSEMTVPRVPSFMPLMAQRAAASAGLGPDKQWAGNGYVPGSPEKSSVEGSPRVLALGQLEFTDSFKSIADSVTSAQTDMSDADTVAESVYNMFSVSTPSSDSCMWKPRNGVYTSGDIINCLGLGRPGYGIHEVLSTYTNLHSVLLSLMTGRTVLVVGPAKMEMEVTKVVTALSIFLPDTKRKQNCVVDWMNRPMKITDLTRIRLAGICRSEKRSLDSTIPTAVKQYSTLMDVERRFILGPSYHGSLLNSVLHQKKSFKTDAQHVAYIHSWLMELSMKAYIFYHSFCLGEAGGLTHSHSVVRHREQYSATIGCLMNRLGVRDHDIIIIEYLAEKVKHSQLEPHIWVNSDRGSIVNPLTITSRGSHSFRC